MTRATAMAAILVMLLPVQVGSAAGTIGPVRADRTVQGRVIGRPPGSVDLLAMDFADPRHGALAIQHSPCPRKRCAAFLATDDGGQTWRTRSTGIVFVDLSFVSPALGFGVDGAGTLFSTRDGGRHWAARATGAGRVYRVDFTDAQHGWLLAGGLYRTVTGGAAWIHLPFRCGPNQLIGRLSFVDRKTGFLLCQVMNGPFAVTLYRSDDGGVSWRRIAVVDPMAHAVGAFDFLSSRIGYVSAGFGNLLDTTDGGHTFRQVPGTPFEGVGETSWFRPRIGFVSTRTVLMRTDNAGNTWRQIYPAAKSRGAISFAASGAGVGAATDWSPAAILQTANGIDWRQVAQLPATTIDGLVRTSTGTVWAVAASIDGADFQVHLYRSIDNGRHWRQMLRVPGGGGFLSFAGSRLGFLATTTPFRFYVTTNGGSAWSRRSESRRTWNDEYVSASSGWAFGSGGILLHTDDAGNHWRRIAVRIAGIRLTSVYTVGRRHVWITGTNCTAIPCVPVILRSVDDGMRWTLIRFHHAFAVDGFDWVTPHLGYVVDNGGLYRTSDGGITWRIVTR